MPEAAHKVGESSVEIGAHYFSQVLGLKQHLEERQLKKFGFRFFSSEGRRDIDAVTELGASRYLSVPSYQIDRGIFENFLGEEARRRGIAFVDGALVQRDRARRGRRAAPHRLARRRRQRHAAEARWLVDASGRAGLLKRKLGLAEANAHDANAVWFRISDRLAIDDWPGDADVAGALRAAGALALDQPPGRRRLLGLADPAVVGRALGRHRRRRASCIRSRP